MRFLKIGQLVLNLRHIESVGMDVEFQGKRVTFVRMNRAHTQQKRLGEEVQMKEISISYRFEGRAAQAINLFFGGEMPLYPGYNGWLFDIAQGMKNYEKVRAKEEFEQAENKVVGIQEQLATGIAVERPKIDLGKVRLKLEKKSEEV